MGFCWIAERGLNAVRIPVGHWILGPPYPWPGWFYFTAFRSGRTKMQLELDETSFDYRYYRDKGWFESDYFYPTRLGPVKRTVGRLIDSVQKRQTQRRRSSQAPS